MTAEPSAVPPAIRVLLLVSNPLDAPISIANDMAVLADTIRDLAVHAEFLVRVAETDAIGSLLAQRNRPPFHVLHYLGHGNRPPDAQSGYLILEDKTGGARALESFRLHAVLNPTGTPEFELAVLSACYSESVAETIISLGVRHIVAIEADASVYEIAAVQFYPLRNSSVSPRPSVSLLNANYLPDCWRRKTHMERQCCVFILTSQRNRIGVG